MTGTGMRPFQDSITGQRYSFVPIPLCGPPKVGQGNGDKGMFFVSTNRLVLIFQLHCEMHKRTGFSCDSYFYPEKYSKTAQIFRGGDGPVPAKSGDKLSPLRIIRLRLCRAACFVVHKSQIIRDVALTQNAPSTSFELD